MTLRQAIKKADRIFVSVHMNPGTSYSIKISKKDARIVSKDYLDEEFIPGYGSLRIQYLYENIENEEASIIAYFDVSRSILYSRFLHKKIKVEKPPRIFR